MLDKIILSDSYFRVLLVELEKYGYITRPSFLDFLDSDFYIKSAIKWLGQDGFISTMTTVYQMALLADQIIIYDPMNESDTWDLTRCNDFNILLEKQKAEEYVVNIDEVNYIDNFIKPIVMKKLSNLYGERVLPEYIIEIVLHNTTNEALKLLPDNNIDWTEWIIKIQSYALDIIDMQELSATNDCPALSSSYNLCFQDNLNMYNSQLNTYALVRISYNNIIGKLPVFNNVHEVLKLKNERKSDIKRLRNVLDEFEHIIRTEGQEKAIGKIVTDINKASMELAKRNPAKTVNQWANILLVPISVVEKLVGLPPIGLSLKVIAWLTNISLERYKNRYNWIDLIR